MVEEGLEKFALGQKLGVVSKQQECKSNPSSPAKSVCGYTQYEQERDFGSLNSTDLCCRLIIQNWVINISKAQAHCPFYEQDTISMQNLISEKDKEAENKVKN